MEKQEFSILAAVLKSAYQRDNFMSDKESISVWYSFLKEYDYKDVSNATSNYIKSETFPPTIADIISYTNRFRGATWSVEWNKIIQGCDFNELDYPAQYALQTIGEHIVSERKSINIMLEFKRIYKDFTLMDKSVKAEIFRSGLLEWKKEEKKQLEEQL